MSRTFFSSGKQPLLAVMMLAASASPAETPRITVLRTGRNALVRSAFNERKDLVLDVKDANEDAYFIAKNTPLENYKSGQFIHQGVDDFSAIQLADFGYLSGNHGSYFGHKLTVAEHGLSEKDIGSTVVHGSGTKMCLVDVPDKFLRSGGGWRFFDQYIPEMEERHGKVEEGLVASEAHKAGYIPENT